MHPSFGCGAGDGAHGGRSYKVDRRSGYRADTAFRVREDRAYRILFLVLE